MSALIDGTTLDHVAVAVERWSDAWPRYAVELGGAWSSGGLNVGFGPAQLRFANGGRVEILQPWRSEDNPFLRRFLDRHGPGPHHLTFKVPDLASTLGRARTAGFSPVGVDLTSPDWMEAFLHPRQATGIVVQLAQAAYAWESPPPEGFPTPRPGSPASLLQVTHAVADLDTALALFEGLLGGRRTARATAPDRAWEYADLQWPGSSRLRLVSPVRGTGDSSSRADTPLGTWLGELSGRLHHLVFSLPGLHSRGHFDQHPDVAPRSDVPGLLPEEGSARVVEPEDNLGTRLVLLGGDAPIDI